MNILSRADARLQHERFYYTGVPCTHGHITERRTTNGECVECARAERARNQAKRTAKFKALHGSDYQKVASNAHYLANKQRCIDRATKWRHDHPEIHRAAANLWRINHPQYMSTYLQKWWSTHPDKSREYRNKPYAQRARSNWRVGHRGVVAFYARTRTMAVRMATPKWADLESIRQIYIKCAEISASTGIPHQVDHIVPVLGKNVRGLHVEHNLQIIPKSENISKSNRHDSD